MDLTETFSSITQYSQVNNDSQEQLVNQPTDQTIDQQPDQQATKNTTKNTNEPIFQGIFGKETIEVNTTLADLMTIIIAFYGILYVSQVSSIFTCQQVQINESHKIYQYIFTFGIFYFIALLVNKSELDIPPIQKLLNCVIYFIIFLILNRLDYKIMMTVLALIFLIYFIFVNKQYYYKLNPSNNTATMNPNTTFNPPTKTKSNSTSSSSSNALSVAESLLNTPKNTLTQDASSIADHQYWITWDFPRVRLFAVEPYQYFYISLLNKFVILLLVILVIIGFINYIGILKYTFKNQVTLYNIFVEDTRCEPLNYALSFTDYMLLAFNYNYYIKKLKPINKVIYPYATK